MARTFTVAQLATKVRERADMPDEGFISASELRGYLSASYTHLYDLLVKSGLSYFEGTQSIASLAGTATYALPSDFYGAIGVDYRYDSTNYTALVELMPQERNVFQAQTGQAHAYRIVGGNTVLYPTPPAGQTYRLVYIPAPADLTSDGTTVDGVSGWEEFIVVDAAIKCLLKEESSTTALERERQRLLERIEEAAENRRAGGSSRIVDVDGVMVAAGSYWPRHGVT